MQKYSEIPQRQTGALILLCLALALFAVTLLRTAWVSEDAYITLRTIDNFLNGYGLRWNVAERVQSYTHPLWMFFVMIPYAITREAFLTLNLLSIATSLLAVALLVFGIARARLAALAALVVLLFSRAFVDYATSGLENPLTHVLLALFLLVWFRTLWAWRDHFLLALLAALCMLNRLDTALFFAPALLYAFLAERNLKTFGAILLGLSPLILWELFSLVYYGFPFPNTAYAKLGTGIPDLEVIGQGLNYYLYTLTRDPVTLPAILAAILVCICRRDVKAIVMALGLVLYLLYILKIGGDFMGGRFFATPLFLAMALFVRWPAQAGILRWAPALALIAVASLAAPFAPPTTGRDFGASLSEQQPWKLANGIGDERRFYFNEAGLIHYQRGRDMPAHSFATQGRAYAAKKDTGTHVHGSVGFRGYFGGPTVHIIDYYALADPLLARIPARYAPNWRIGHFQRIVPPGYQQTAGGSENQIQDPALREYYDKLRLIVAGPLFSPERWKAIAAMNLGQYDYLIDQQRYRFPGLRRMPLQALTGIKKAGSAWNGPGTVRIDKDGLLVDLGEVHNNYLVEFSADHNDIYKVLWLREGEVLAQKEFDPPSVGSGGLSIVNAIAPNRALRLGYDAIHILPLNGDERYSIGHLRLR